MLKRLYIINQHYYPELASTGQVFQEIAEHYAKSGYEVKVIAGRAFYHEGEKLEHFPNTLNGVSILRLWNTSFKKSSLPGKLFNLLTFQLSLAFYGLLFIPGKAYVMVGTNPPLALLSLLPARAVKRFKLVSVVQDLYPDILLCSGHVKEDSFLFRLLSGIMKRAFGQCDHIVTISKDMKNHMEKVYGCKRLKVITNMVIGDIFPLSNGDGVDFQACSQDLLVMYSGNFGIAHEYETLLETVRLLQNNETIRFKITGGGIHYYKLKKACEAERLSNISFFPYAGKGELNKSLNEADIHLVIFDKNYKNVLMPSKYYGVLACGKPVILIASGENDISRDIDAHLIGYRVENHEASRLKDILIELSQDKGRLEAMGQRAYVLYKEKYERNIVLDEYVKLIESL